LISRADVARATHLTAPTVSTAIAELMSEGLVEEVGSISTDRGKPPILIQLIKDAKLVIALDLSRNVFRGALLNLRGEVKYQLDVAVENRTKEEALTLVYQLIDDLLAQSPIPVMGIGIGVPGIIDIDRGYLHQAVNLGWYNLPLRELLVQRYKLAAMVLTTIRRLVAVPFWEHQKQQHLVVIRVGNGIGAGMLLNNQLLQSHGVGEIGHVMVQENGELCSCGNYGCLETVISNRAVIKQAQSIARQHPESLLNQFASSPDSITIDSIIQAVAAGDATLQPLIEVVGQHLGSAIANLIGVLGMTKILLAGRVAQFGQPLLEIVKEEVCKRSLTARLDPPVIDLVTIRPTSRIQSCWVRRLHFWPISLDSFNSSDRSVIF
jgi:predicted NBD/HSP70 family sugar kinase